MRILQPNYKKEKIPRKIGLQIELLKEKHN